MVQRLNRSVVKALDVLEAIATAENGGITPTEVATRVGLSRGSVYPILRALEQRGYVHKDSTKGYQLGPVFLRYAYRVLNQLKLPETARPVLQKLASKLNLNVHLGILHHRQVLYLDRVVGSNTVVLGEIIGLVEPAYCTALGKTLLASLSDVELEAYLAEEKLLPLTPHTITDASILRDVLKKAWEEGYAINDEEAHEGIVGVAAPIKDFRGRTVAAISISIPKDRFLAMKEELINEVKLAAAEICERLGHSELGSLNGCQGRILGGKKGT